MVTCLFVKNLLLPQRGSLKRPSKAATLIGTEIYLWGLAGAFLHNAKDCGRARIKGERHCGLFCCHTMQRAALLFPVSDRARERNQGEYFLSF